MVSPRYWRPEAISCRVTIRLSKLSQDKITTETSDLKQGLSKGSPLIWKISLRTFAVLCVLCGKKAFKTINRKERQERKGHAKG